MKSSDQIGLTFVNAVVGRGVLNGVVNLQFGALNFDVDDSGKVSSELVVACRLRMDRQCAVQLRDTLAELLAMIERAEAQAVGIAAGAGTEQPETLN